MGEWYGYTGRVLRINLTDRSTRTQELDRSAALMFLGGRGLNSRSLYEEVRAGADPLGPENKVTSPPSPPRRASSATPTPEATSPRR